MIYNARVGNLMPMRDANEETILCREDGRRIGRPERSIGRMCSASKILSKQGGRRPKKRSGRQAKRLVLSLFGSGEPGDFFLDPRFRHIRNNEVNGFLDQLRRRLLNDILGDLLSIP